MGFSDFSIEAEIWQPSVQLRNVERKKIIHNGLYEKIIVLQQLYTSNLGNREWKDVATVIES